MVGSKKPKLLVNEGHITSQGNRRDLEWYVQKDEKPTVLREAQCGVADVHYTGDVIAWKVWQSGLWWQTTLKDALKYCWECDLCQRMGQPT